MGLRGRLFGSAGGTKVATAEFQIRLANDWKAAHEPTHYGFVREPDGEQITISVQRSRTRRDKPTLLLAALEAVAARQRAFGGISGGAASFGDPESTDVADGVDVTFGIADTSAPVQARVWVLARPQYIVTLTFLRYDPLVEPGIFLEKCDEIRKALSLK